MQNLGNIQDVASFMKAIGRKCEEVSSKFEVILGMKEDFERKY